MEAVPCSEPAIVVQVVGWTATVQVLIDGQPVGVLRDQRARSLSVGAGVHRVAAKVSFLRSRTLVLTLAPGERISLECGFHRWMLALPLASAVATLIGLLLMKRGLYGEARMPNVLAAVLNVAYLIMAFAVPGGRLYLKRSGAAPDAGALPQRMDAASPAVRSERGQRGFQFSLRGLLILVACCAPLFLMGRELWDRRPGNETARAIRLLQSGGPSARLSAASDLRYLLIGNSLTPEQVDAIIPDLLVAMRDRNPGLREAAAFSLFMIVVQATQRSAPVPQIQAVAAGLAEGLRDTAPDVRDHTAQALSNIYFSTSVSGGPTPPLPVDTERFVDLLGQAIEDPSPQVRSRVFWILRTIAPRLERASPARLLKALDASDAAIRREAVKTVVKFPLDIDSALPALLRVLECDPDPGVRRECSTALLLDVRPSPASIPLLVEALRSPERPVRFRVAELLGRIGPQASEAVPAILPLLKETFEPTTSHEREHPEWTDPAAAASWALGAIAPGTGMADTARASLVELLRQSGHPWRRPNAEWALGRLDPASTQEPGDVQAGAPSQ